MTGVFQAIRARRLWLVVGWLLVLLVIYLSLTPKPVELPLEQGDKFSHVLAYFVLMSWFANIYDGLVQRFGFALGFVLLGATLEFLQGLSGYRTFEVADIVACVAGVATAWILCPPRVPNYILIVEMVFEVAKSRKKRNKTRGRE